MDILFFATWWNPNQLQSAGLMSSSPTQDMCRKDGNSVGPGKQRSIECPPLADLDLPPAPSCLQTLHLFLPHPQPFTTLSPSPPSLPASFSSSLSFLFLFFFFKTKFIVLIIKTTERHYRESGNQRNKDEKPDQLQPPPPALPASLWAWFPAACFF